MNNAPTGHLRAARSEIIPQVPYLAPQLKQNPEIIRDAIIGSLERRKVSDDAFPTELDLNKTERHTIAGFLIGEQRKVLVEGEGEEARFRDFHELSVADGLSLAVSSVRISRGHVSIANRQENGFRVCLQKTLASGAREIKETYTNGFSPERQWLPQARRRYRSLGRQAVDAHALKTVPIEGQYLHQALRTKALAISLPPFLTFVKEHVPDPAEHISAAHDLAYLMLTHSALHIRELLASMTLERLIANVSRDDEGTYRPSFARNNNRAAVFRRLPNLPNARLKCPAHSAQAGDVTADTNLTFYAHAAINAAATHNLI